MTPHMIADKVAFEFNNVRERSYWRAQVGGTRTLPVVYFKSRSSMVELVYYPSTDRFAVTFSRVTCAYGDYMASTHKALLHVLTALKASGHEVNAPLDDKDGVLRVEFDPTTKATYVALAKLADDWTEYNEPTLFKGDVPVL